MADISKIKVSNALYNVKDETARNGLTLKAPITSPALAGTPTAPNPQGGDSSTQIATTSFVQSELNKEILVYTMTINVATNAEIGRVTNGAITADYVLLECVFANPSAITSNVAWTTGAGYVSFSGTCTASTTATVTLGRKGN